MVPVLSLVLLDEPSLPVHEIGIVSVDEVLVDIVDRLPLRQHLLLILVVLSVVRHLGHFVVPVRRVFIHVSEVVVFIERVRFIHGILSVVRLHLNLN